VETCQGTDVLLDIYRLYESEEGLRTHSPPNIY